MLALICFILLFLVKTPQRKNPEKSSVETPDASKAETPAEKKKNYWAYKNRDGPTSLGTKELPKVLNYFYVYFFSSYKF